MQAVNFSRFIHKSTTTRLRHKRIAEQPNNRITQAEVDEYISFRNLKITCPYLGDDFP